MICSLREVPIDFTIMTRASIPSNIVVSVVDYLLVALLQYGTILNGCKRVTSVWRNMKTCEMSNWETLDVEAFHQLPSQFRDVSTEWFHFPAVDICRPSEEADTFDKVVVLTSMSVNFSETVIK